MKTKEEVIKESWGEAWNKLSKEDQLQVLEDNGYYYDYQFLVNNDIDSENMSEYGSNYEFAKFRPKITTRH